MGDGGNLLRNQGRPARFTMNKFLKLTHISGADRRALINVAHIIAVQPDQEVGCHLICCGEFEFHVKESFEEVQRKLNLANVEQGVQ
jgi:hypothetical protein